MSGSVAFYPLSMVEVARFKMPLAVRGMDKLVDWLEESYGEGLSMRQDGDWMLVERPT